MNSDEIKDRPHPGRVRQTFLNIAPFLVMAVFKIWSSLGQTAEALLPAAVAMLVFSVIILIVAYRWDRPNYFDWAVITFFAFISVFLIISPRTAGYFLFRYPVTGIYAVLFAAAFFPPLLGMDPFTYPFAKQKAPREFWNHPYFIQINRIITHVWSAIFFVALLLSLYPSMVTRVILPLAIILGLGFPFNRRFPAYYLKKKGIPGEALSKLK